MKKQTLLISALLFVPCIVFFFLGSRISCQQSKPIANIQQLNDLLKSSKFAQKKVVLKKDVSFGQDGTKFSKTERCKHTDLDIRWQTQVGSSVYQTPAIQDFFGDGRQEVIIPTFVRYLEVLHGSNGAEANSVVGIRHRHEGSADEAEHDQNEHIVQQWPFSHPNFAAHSGALLYDIDKDGQFEIVQALLSGEIVFLKRTGKVLTEYNIKVQPLKVRKDWYKGLNDKTTDISMSLYDDNDGNTEGVKNVDSFNAEKNPDYYDSIIKNKQRKRVGNRKTLSTEDNSKKGTEGYFSREAIESMDLISYVPQSLRPFVDPSSDNPFYAKKFEEQFEKIKQETPKSYVFIDPHILSTPVIVDIDDDGKDDLIVAVSYYFDREHYSKPENMRNLDIDVDLSKYVAGGLIVYDLTTLEVKWDVHLDLTTDTTKLRAFIYSSPSVADIDFDGSLEVVIATALGFIYAFNKHGVRKEGFPVMLSQIQGQVTIEDINSDGDLELCAVDFRSNLVCFDGKGKIVWERQLSGFSSQAPAVGDVNGDGVLDLVVGTSTGHIWAVRGDNGKVLPHFPVKTNGQIYSTALLANLNTTIGSGLMSYVKSIFSPKRPENALTIIMPSFDGFVYLIDGYEGCIDKIDIGEKSYTQPLLADLSGSGNMDLLISTMNGNIYCFGTAQPFHPLKVSNNQLQSMNGFATRYNYHGIYVTPESRTFRDVIGNNFKIKFEIVDKRKMKDYIPRRYKVRMNIGNHMELLTKTYYKPGTYVEVVPAPSERMYGTITVQMTNEHGQTYSDHFSVSFNMNFLATIKWAIVVPFVAVCSAVMFLYFNQEKDLPM